MRTKKFNKTSYDLPAAAPMRATIDIKLLGKCRQISKIDSNPPPILPNKIHIHMLFDGEMSSKSMNTLDVEENRMCIQAKHGG